jgi:hypothetical protein
MRRGVSKEDVKRFAQLGKDRQKVIVEQKGEEEGTKMETKLENEIKRKIVSFSNGCRLMFSDMDKFQCWVVTKDVTWAKTIRLSDLTTFKLTPIKHPIVREFLKLIVWLNVNVMESVV